MIKTDAFSLLRFNKFKFGKQEVTQFVLFQYKYLFSIIFFYFHKADGAQDRYHTHAFNALSIKFFGTYDEFVLKSIPKPGYPAAIYVNKRDTIFKYFPKDSFHCIANSTGCLTMLLSGPWDKNWIEWKDGVITHYTWGRK